MFDAKPFFDAYRDSFSSGPAAVASFYAEPCVTARGGAVRVNATHADTTAIMTAVDQQYRDRGFNHGAYELVEAHGAGANAAIATVRWSYKNVGGHTLWQTTFTYNLYRGTDGWKILVQTMHDE
jgi:ketosteroid isomerase-like protein